MGRPALNILGQRFGRVVVVERVASHTKAARWRVKCDCGGERVIVGSKLVSGQSGASCGCLKREHGRRTATRHGQAAPTNRSPTWVSWQAMRCRCLIPKANAYSDYGGRGITICERWDVFENFLADMGERPKGKTLDRRDVNGNYEPSNCRWATAKEQANNTRVSRESAGSVQRG